MQQRQIVRQGRFQGTAFVYKGADQERLGQGTILTSGSSTTVTSGTGTLSAPGTNWANQAGAVQAFSQAAVGDQVRVVQAGVEATRFITAKATHDSVTVDTALNIPAPGIVWYHTPQPGGLTDADGWVNVQGLVDKLFYVELTTKGSALGITYSIEARGAGPNAVPRQLVTSTLTAAVVAGTINPAAADQVVIPEAVQDIRLGVKNANDGLDIVNAWVTGVLA